MLLYILVLVDHKPQNWHYLGSKGLIWLFYVLNKQYSVKESSDMNSSALSIQSLFHSQFYSH
jgi:hypothetical protein